MLSTVKLLASLALFPFFAFFRCAITEVKTTLRPVDAEVLGALPTQSGIVGLISNLKANAAGVFGNFIVSTVSLAANTYTARQLTGGIIRRVLAVGAATTDSTDTATNIVNAIPGAVVGQTFPLLISNLMSATLTVAAGTGVTLTGTATVTRFSTRLFLGEVTGSAAVTITNCFQFMGGTLPADVL